MFSLSRFTASLCLATLALFGPDGGFRARSQVPVSKYYHDITARYNGYFIAKERMAEIEAFVHDNYTWNFNTLLPVFALYDSTSMASMSTKIVECIEKASIAIQRHPESSWTHRAYLVIGRARMYGVEFPDAIETFKYVNTHADAEEVRQLALIYLLRSYLESGEVRNSKATVDHLGRKKIRDVNLERYHLNLAYFYQVKEDWPQMVLHLRQSLLHVKDKAYRARLFYILGQVESLIEHPKEAHEAFLEAISLSKDYDITLNSRLNLVRLTPSSRAPSTERKIARYFRKMLNDEKNKPDRDRIYYHMGLHDYQKGNYKEALARYKDGLKEPSSGQELQGILYHAIASLYYDDLEDYYSAKPYYDSTIQVISEAAKGYDLIFSRQSTLSEFLTHYQELQACDSLLALSRLSGEELESFLSGILQEEQRAFEGEMRKKRRARILSSGTSGGGSGFSTFESKTISDQSSVSGDWYFYIPSEVVRGKAEFQRLWGNRALGDNWRRLVGSSLRGPGREGDGRPQRKDSPLPSLDRGKFPEGLAGEELGSGVAGKEGQQPSADGVDGSGSPQGDEFLPEQRRKELLSKIPGEEQMPALLGRLEKACYHLGFIYNLKLAEKENAVDMFCRVVNEFPDSDRRAESLYQLFLISKARGENAESQHLRLLMKVDYPDSVYTHLSFNPNYLEDLRELNEQYRAQYLETYDLYLEKKFEESLHKTDSLLATWKDESLTRDKNLINEYGDNLELVRTFNIGHTRPAYDYQKALNRFIHRYPDSELAPRASYLLKVSQDHQINLYSSSAGRYVSGSSRGAQLFILLYPRQDASLEEKLLEGVRTMVRDKAGGLDLGRFVLSDQYASLTLESFPDKRFVTTFIEGFGTYASLEKSLEENEILTLAITRENLDILFETKDVDSYLQFFNRHYQL